VIFASQRAKLAVLHQVLQRTALRPSTRKRPGDTCQPSPLYPEECTTTSPRMAADTATPAPNPGTSPKMSYRRQSEPSKPPRPARIPLSSFRLRAFQKVGASPAGPELGSAPVATRPRSLGTPARPLPTAMWCKRSENWSARRLELPGRSRIRSRRRIPLRPLGSTR